jgi:putative redox protein
MTTSSAHIAVTVQRASQGTYTAVNARGGQVTMGTGAGTDFTPVELMLAAIGGCTGIDVDVVTSRRAEPEAFEVVVDADKIKDDTGNLVTGIEVTFRVRFPAGEGGDAARAVLPDIVRKSHGRLCSVGRTIEAGTPVTIRIDSGEGAS